LGSDGGLGSAGSGGWEPPEAPVPKVPFFGGGMTWPTLPTGTSCSSSTITLLQFDFFLKKQGDFFLHFFISSSSLHDFFVLKKKNV